MSILFEQLLESLDLDEACDKNLNEASEQARNAFISLIQDNEIGWEEALDLALGEIDDDTVDMMIDDVRDYNRFMSMQNDTVEESLDEACDKELKEDISVTPGKDKAFELISEFDNSRDMLEELIRYLPEDTVKEFIDYYAENFMGLFDDEMDEGLLSGLANAAITIGNAAADAIQKDQETFESLDEAYAIIGTTYTKNKQGEEEKESFGHFETKEEAEKALASGDYVADELEIVEINETLDESITDKGDIGPKVLAKLEEIINSNTKFKLDTDPDGKMILTDPKQLQFKVDIDGNDFILMDKSGKAIIRDADPEKFIKRFIVFVTD